MWRPLLCFLIIYSAPISGPAFGIGGNPIIRYEVGKGGFPLSAAGKSIPLCASSNDFPGVLRVLKMFQNDIATVTEATPDIFIDKIPASKLIIIVGTIGRSTLIDKLIRDKRIDARGVTGIWEASLVQSVDKPFPGVDRALVIAGSDKRGTIYGMFGLSEQIGVSPWYWWADVPAKHHGDVFVLPGRHVTGPPSVKYRGIFLNDEWPSLTNWVKSKYGDVPQGQDPPVPPGVANYSHQFYERIFELLLRLKANYLWPAMWNNAFNEDDKENPKLADEYGIVMGTSHQEPMLRAQKEWDRRYKNTLGSWNYAVNPDALESFWREGIKRNKDFESIITIGLRGADDTPMGPGGPEANKALLEKIIGVQRKILSEETNPDVAKVPQLWCLYKEVLDFYNAGMRVPDDVTLLWPDDNWGNNRRLPTAEERNRKGGAGVYYHFDYHGGPRSYQWINANPLAKIWDQMSLAKEYGADRIWIVNVGHLKGYEIPIEYFMDLAWDTKSWTNDNIHAYTRRWAEREFGSMYAADIADIIAKYTKYNGRRKPELLSPTTYSLVNYREAERVVAEFKAITEKAGEIFGKMPAPLKDAFYGLVLFPTKASAIVNELYFAAGRNALYAKQGRSSANDMAEETRVLFKEDTTLMGYFNRTYAGGKWDHFMDQTHLGYTNWQDPPTNNLRAIHLTEIEVPETASMGVAVEGSDSVWPGAGDGPVLPLFDPFTDQRNYIEIFNKGKNSFTYRATPDQPWIEVSAPTGEVRKQVRIEVNVNWRKAPRENVSGMIAISGCGQTFSVAVKTSRPDGISRENLKGFIESSGFVSMEAEHYTRKTEFASYRWMKVEDCGHTLSAMRTSSALNAPAAMPGKDAPCLEYQVYLVDTGKTTVEGIFGAMLNFMPGRGLHYAVSFDNDPPQVVTLVVPGYSAQNGNRDWEKSVEDNARHSHSTHFIRTPGYHTLKVWMVDPGVVLEKLVLNSGGVKPSYLGPPESYHSNVRGKGLGMGGVR